MLRLIQLIQERTETEAKIAKVISEITIGIQLLDQAIQASLEKEAVKQKGYMEGK